jgi:hypothetical protein
MRTAIRREHRFDPLDPRGILCFLGLVGLWIGWGFLPTWEALAGRIVARAAGYVALGCMLVPYLHILQRSFRSKPGRPISSWLRWHIAASYIGFALLLVHCGARAGSPLTFALLCATWVVMVSGAVGFYGQKLLYAMFPALGTVPYEVGRERLGPEREDCLKKAEAFLGKKEFTEAPPVVQEFVRRAINRHLAPEFRFWRRSAARGTDDEPEEERYELALLAAGSEAQATMVRTVWGLVTTRAALNTEYRLHRLGRLWLLFHGPAAWVLLVLLVEHVLMSVWYGGW